MSAYRQYATDTGYVVSFADPEPAHELGLTEVQVAPLDAIVIDRSELPEVGDAPGIGLYTGNDAPVAGESDVDYHTRRALAHLAMREYLLANPPVNEAQVQALADALVALDDSDAGDDAYYIPAGDARMVARRLVQNGVRVEVTP